MLTTIGMMARVVIQLMVLRLMSMMGIIVAIGTVMLIIQIIMNTVAYAHLGVLCVLFSFGGLWRNSTKQIKGLVSSSFWLETCHRLDLGDIAGVLKFLENAVRYAATCT